jgi:CRISPR-associated protein Cas5h
MNALVFDIWSDYGHFRKPYTTTSPLTFPFPPRTAMAGIISAIIGKDKNDVSCQTQESFISISIHPDYPVKKMRVGENLVQVPKRLQICDLNNIKNKLNQIRYEFLKDPRYTVYFSHKNPDIYETLKKHLENHTSVYTPYLGISELIANFEYLGEFEIKECTGNGTVELGSVLPKKLLKDNSIELSDNAEYFNTRMPNRMNNDRVTEEYIEIIFERNGRTIKAKPHKYWQLEDGKNIIFL